MATYSPSQSFITNDKVTLKYIDTAPLSPATPPLILLHGFTGSSQVWQRNIPAFVNAGYRVIAPDLRGHGESGKPKHGYHVARLARDLEELLENAGILHLEVKAIGGSLGAAILWSYASLFTTTPFTHLIFIDQSPLQNLLPDWDTRFCNRGLNSSSSLSTLQNLFATNPAEAHKGTIASCLSYRSHPLPTDSITEQIKEADEAFFLREAMKGNGIWLGKLMADHTALDWRDAISAAMGKGSGSKVKVLVVASSRSGCFPAAGPMYVVELVNGEGEGEGRARGEVVDWGGHWCYWEDAERFDGLCLEFLGPLGREGLVEGIS